MMAWVTPSTAVALAIWYYREVQTKLEHRREIFVRYTEMTTAEQQRLQLWDLQ